MKILVKSIFIMLLIVSITHAQETSESSQAHYPELTSWVNDYVWLLSSEQEQELNRLLVDFGFRLINSLLLMSTFLFRQVFVILVLCYFFCSLFLTPFFNLEFSISNFINFSSISNFSMLNFLFNSLYISSCLDASSISLIQVFLL